jgi:hypothetical protein
MEKARSARILFDSGTKTVEEIATTLGIGRATCYRYLAQTTGAGEDTAGARKAKHPQGRAAPGAMAEPKGLQAGQQAIPPALRRRAILAAMNQGTGKRGAQQTVYGKRPVQTQIVKWLIAIEVTCCFFRFFKSYSFRGASHAAPAGQLPNPF